MDIDMDYVVTTEQMRFCDRQTSAYYQIPEMVLMERAALSVAQTALRMLSDRKRQKAGVLVLCGSGNNGADGYAAARLLRQWGVRVQVLFCGEDERRSELNRKQEEIALRYGVPCSTVKSRKGRLTITARKEAETEYDNIEETKAVFFQVPDDVSLVIDALFGIGLSRPIEGTMKMLIDEAGTWHIPVLAVDMPSGIDSEYGTVMECALAAEETVTFGFRKTGLMVNEGPAYAGAISVADIGITADSFMGELPGRRILTARNVLHMLPVREKNGNKGTFGKLLLMAGSPNMSGACTLAASAAYRAGAGMVRIITCSENIQVLKQTIPEALLTVVDEELQAGEKERRLMEALRWADVVAAGCGIGISDGMWETLQLLYDMMCGEMRKKPLILDADALNLIAGTKNPAAFLQKREPCTTVLTPHAGELARLCGCTIAELKKDFIRISEAFAADCGCILVAKEARTYLSMADETGVCRGCFNMTGNDGMATAGSGDVLTGMILAFAAVGTDLFDAACLGVYLHGLAGECASDTLGKESVMASDIVRHISAAIRKLRLQPEESSGERPF